MWNETQPQNGVEGEILECMFNLCLYSDFRFW
nr:MAG TPA: RNA dependent RNA polymerase [Caudoviricetes sp.]